MKKMTLAGSLLGIPFDLEAFDAGKNRIEVKGSVWGRPVDLAATVSGKSFEVVGTLLGEPLKVTGSDKT